MLARFTSLTSRTTRTWAPEARAAYLAGAYRDVVEDRARLDEVLARLPDRPGRKRREAWAGLAQAGAFQELAGELIEAHYDPAYRRSSRKDERTPLAVLPVSTLDPAGFERTAESAAKLIASL